MPTYYLDIGIDEGLGSKDGSTPENCMGWNQFGSSASDNFTINNAGTYLIKGSRTLTLLSTIGFNFNYPPVLIEMLPWDLSVYGPWRLYLQPSGSGESWGINDVSRIEGGIVRTKADMWVQTGNAAITDIGIFNSVLYAYGSGTSSQVIFSNFGTGSNLNVNIKGSRLALDPSSPGLKRIGLSGNSGTEKVIINAENSVFEGQVVDFGDSEFNADYCAMRNNPGSGTVTNSQLDWVPGSFLTPAWDAARISWSVATINAGITQAGSGSYSGYATDLWGIARTTLGTGDMMFHGYSVPDMRVDGTMSFGTEATLIDSRGISATDGTFSGVHASSRMVVSGRVGIGTTNPTYTLDITGTNPTFNITGGSPYLNVTTPNSADAIDLYLETDTGVLDLYSWGSTAGASLCGVSADGGHALWSSSGPLFVVGSNVYLGSNSGPVELAVSGGRVDMTASVRIKGDATVSGNMVAAGSIQSRYPVANETSDSSLLAGASGTLYTNTGTPAMVNLVLPQDATGVHYFFANTDASGMRVTAQPTQYIWLGGLPSQAGGYIDTTVIGATAHLVNLDGDNWFGLSVIDIWSILT